MRWGGGRRQPEDLVDTVVLTLDAAFFSTGECVGPDTKQLGERVMIGTDSG
ncbi:MAG TPA: hypothetical protein VHY84_28745 [Bryobacteraceae bacterium]|jgi:hypothetical protein|nr:hypothetical protein [Bryobacteraceae bacterium]